MNLPDFSKHVGLNQLRQSMGTELISWNSGEEWKSINIDKILVTTGIEITPDEIETADDGTLEYAGRKVAVYIRDIRAQYVPIDSTREKLPRFHVADCDTLRDMRRSNRYERYVVTSRTDGKFIVNFLQDQVEEAERRLYVCKNCLDRLNYNGYRRRGNAGRDAIRDYFDLSAFFEKYDSQITREPTHTDITAPVNTYPPNWEQISYRYKEKRNWKCEECGVNLAGDDSKGFLHVHHKNGLKYDNREQNLCALCIRCHAKMPQHQHMRSKRDYKEYMQMSKHQGRDGFHSDRYNDR